MILETTTAMLTAILFQYLLKPPMTNRKKIKIILDKLKIHPSTIKKDLSFKLPLDASFKKIKTNEHMFQDHIHKNVTLTYDPYTHLVHVNILELPEKITYRPNENEKLINFNKTTNVIVGGTTGYGKTNLINVLITDLVLTDPKHTKLYLIDLKEGVEFEKFRKLEQTCQLSTNVETTYHLLQKAMQQLKSIQNKAIKEEWTNINNTRYKDRYYVIIDEAGDLSPESYMDKKEKYMRKECLVMLTHLARIGRAFGFRMVFSSQYTTADVLPRQIKQNADAKICFKIQNEYASEVVLGKGNTEAADLPDIRGRAVKIDGSHKEIIQVPYLNQNYLKKWEVEKCVEREENKDTGSLIEFRDII